MPTTFRAVHVKEITVDCIELRVESNVDGIRLFYDWGLSHKLIVVVIDVLGH
jgi:hypothetical protein